MLKQNAYDTVLLKKPYNIYIFPFKHIHKKRNEIRVFGRNDGGIGYESSLLFFIFLNKHTFAH